MTQSERDYEMMKKGAEIAKMNYEDKIKRLEERVFLLEIDMYKTQPDRKKNYIEWAC